MPTVPPVITDPQHWHAVKLPDDHPHRKYRPRYRTLITEDQLIWPDEDIGSTLYLGTHMPHWLAEPRLRGFLGRQPVRLFVSHRRLAPRRTLPRAVVPWALDSGAYSELYLYGEWRTDAGDYAAAVRRYHDEIGLLEFACPQDWMCEPWILRRTGLTVEEHQLRTVENYLNLQYADPDLPWVPVLQGWTRDDYLRGVEIYANYGFDLSLHPVVGLGSMCRRHNTAEALRIIEALREIGITRLHGFGFKTRGLEKAHHLLVSADSLAWSYSARRADALPGCTHRSCANCLRYALAWRQRILHRMPEWHQMTLLDSTLPQYQVA